MLSVVSNRDLPDYLFDVQEEIVIHVAKNLENAIKYSEVDMMVLFDINWSARRYLRSLRFEALVDSNPNISFLVVSKRSTLFNFINDMTVDYKNLDIVSIKELEHSTITDRPCVSTHNHSFISWIGGWFEGKFDLREGTAL